MKNIQIDTSKVINVLSEITHLLYKPTTSPYGEMIDKKLKKIFGKNIDQFKNMMEKSGNIISGSFVLQSILNEDWNGDIDIFCLQNNFEDFIKKNKINFEKINYDDKYYGNINILENTKYQINGAIFDIIVLNCDNINKYIENNFDFDILKNFCYVKNNKFFVDVIYSKQIQEKTFEFNHTHNFQKSLERMDKYIKRGFTIIAYRKINEGNIQIKKCSYDWDDLFEDGDDDDDVTENAFLI